MRPLTVLRLVSLGYCGLIGASALAGAGIAHGQALPERPPNVMLRTGFDELPPPGTRRFTRPPRARNDGRQRPRRYGNPSGSGAGATGFVSTDMPPSSVVRRPLNAREDASEWVSTVAPDRWAIPAPELSVAPEARTASGRPASPLPGTLLQEAQPELPAPRQRDAIEEDAFAPVGVHAGSFIVRPAIELGGGYSSNPGRFTGGRGSWFYSVAPEVRARSDWSRHELSLALRGSYVGYEAVPEVNQPSLDSRLNARIDWTRDLWANVEGRYLLGTSNPGSPDLLAGLARLPIFTTLGGTVGLSRRFNRLEINVSGTIDRVAYENSRLTNGVSVSNADRDYQQYGGLVRASYDLMPGIKPFVEATADTRIHDLPVDRFGQQRDSKGVTGRAGSTFEVSGKLTGSLSLGYLMRTYKDPALPDLSGLIADGSLVWTATGLTTVKLTAQSTAGETILPGISGVLRRDAAVQIDHAFRRWLIGTARIGYGMDLYRGSPREDQRYLASLGFIYKMTRSIQVKGEVRREWRRSNVAGGDYSADTVMLGMRLQR